MPAPCCTSVFYCADGFGVLRCRDVKPDNFLMGRGGGGFSTVHMIDFGLSKLYCHPSNKRHIAYCEGKKLIGTVRYASVNAHWGFGNISAFVCSILTFSLPFDITTILLSLFTI